MEKMFTSETEINPEQMFVLEVPVEKVKYITNKVYSL